MTLEISATTAHQWLFDGDEIAFLDVREAGQFGEGHPFLAIPLPFSRLELDVARLVPRAATRIVLLDAGDGVAQRAAQCLQQMGYCQVHVLHGGAPGWQQAGYTLFQGVNLPSKTFGERVEQVFGTPHISPQKLRQWQRAHKPFVLWDGRPLAEHRKMTIPGAYCLPNGELPLRWADTVPDDVTPIVVHCAGRTRSILGAQILRSLQVPNPVYALENGTQGWALAGFALEHGSTRDATPYGQGRDHTAQRHAAQQWAAEQGVPTLSAAEAQAWLDDPTRSCFVLDVRSADEFAAHTLPGAQHAPGGQLLQATDQYVGVRGARLLLLDDEGVRAPVVAAWLRLLGHDAAVLREGLRTPVQVPAALRVAPPDLTPPAPLQGEALRQWVARGAVCVDTRPSWEFRQQHPAGARWATRPQLPQVLQSLAAGTPVLCIATDAARAALALQTAQGTPRTDMAWTTWAEWQAAQLPVVDGADSLSDAQAIDYLFFVHDRHDGNLEAARQYLAWETGLLAQCSPQELGIFRLPPA